MEKRKFEFEVEINFKEVSRNPARWFGYVFIYIIIVIIALGLIFHNQLDYMFKNSVAYTEIDSSRIFKDIIAKKGGMVEGVKFEEVSNLTPDLEKRGEELYKSTCASCHGDDGKGKGVAAVGLNPAPRNFTDKNNWKNGSNPSAIYATLQQGIPGSAMVAYDYIPPKDKIALIYFITKFSGKKLEFAQADYDEINAQFKISDSRIEPTQIPINVAKTKIMQDNYDIINKTKELSKAITNEKLLTSKIVQNPEKAANFLMQLKLNNSTNLSEMLLANIPRNGFSYTFVNYDKDTKNAIFSEIKELMKN